MREREIEAKRGTENDRNKKGNERSSQHESEAEKEREMHLINLPVFHYFRVVPWSILKRVVQSSNRSEKKY